MQPNVPLDYAIFQLSPRRSRCELLVSYDGTMEKLASGLVKPFVTHLKVAEEQVALSGKSIKLDVERFKNAETWFTKGTLERFVRFVSTPEVLEVVNSFDAEMSQLEAARKIYSQGVADHETCTTGGVVDGATASDATKNELLRAIDVRLSAVKQDLITACSRASTAGFTPQTVSELQFFADHFGAHRLSEACSKFITLTQKRSDLFNSKTTTWKASSESVLRSSTCSDMSLDDPFDDQPQPATCPSTKAPLSSRRFSREPSPNPINDVDERENSKDKDFDKDKDMGSTTSSTTGKPQLTRRLSVQERISLFENKAQTSPSTSTTPTSTSGKPEFRRLSSEVNSSVADKAVLRRWSGASDMSIDVSGDRKEPDSNTNTPTPSFSSSLRPGFSPRSQSSSDLKSAEVEKDSKLPVRPKFGVKESVLESNSKIPSLAGKSLEVGFENQSASSRTQIEYPPGTIEQFDSSVQMEKDENLESLPGEGSKQQAEIANVSGNSVTKTEGKLIGIQSVTKLVNQNQNIVVEVEPVPAQPRWQSLAQVEKTEGQTETHPIQRENSGLVRGKSQEYDIGSKIGGSQRVMIENLEAFSSVPIDQVQRVRLPKGNQGVNDELKMKANELEKLFAEHQRLRLPGDQSNSARKIRPTELGKDVGKPVKHKEDIHTSPTMLECEPDKGSSEMDKLNSTPMSKASDNRDYDVTPKHNIGSLSVSDDSKGKLYQKYMQKRDAKLKEEWSSKRPEKEAQMKAMHDSLEKSRAEMKVKLSGSTEKSLSGYDTRRRDDKMRSFTETYLGDSSSKSAQGKRVQLNNNTSSPSPRNPTGPIPRSSGKASNTATGRRRLPYDNPLVQSVPNFSDLKKENTRPSPVRPQGRNHARKKSTSDDLLSVNEEKSRRFQALRKNTATTMELNGSRNSDDIDVDDALFTPSKYLVEENEDYEKLSNDMDSKTFPRKGNGISKASVMGEATKNGYTFGDTSFATEETVSMTKNEERMYESTLIEESIYNDNSKGRLSNESDKSGISARPASASASESPISIPSLFRSMGPTLESPGESPGSWNSRLKDPFAFSHEISDIDALDSPTRSPTSWNFQTLSQSEAEAARMRKKWGAAQKPVVGLDSSNSPSRKDLTRGLKRFLKFGRKNRGTENLSDWISATTSEGDDSEDGRDIANRSSEDLRKSRMGFSQSHNSDEGFNGNDLFNEQVQALRSSIPTPPSNFKMREEHMPGSSLKAPKSFFSLSNFRSKGNDSKPR